MWSAPDTAEYNQWALNPSAYQNLSHEEIDWALLAQQWIKMKETFPKDQVPPAPPPPPLGIRKDDIVEERTENEGGEAPMDMETREEAIGQGDEAPPWGGPWNEWNQWDGWNQWNSGSNSIKGVPSGPGSGGGPPVGPPFSFGSEPQPVYGDAGVPGTIDYNHGNAEPFPQDEKVSSRGSVSNHGRSGGKFADGGMSEHIPPGHLGQNVAPGYWSGPPGGPVDGPHAHMGPYTKHNRNLWKHGMGRPPRDRFGRDEKPKEEEDEEDTVQVIDAAKRRHLPAWIRDGLEKMEREKQKRLDRERQLKERAERLEQQRVEDEEEAASIAAGGMPKKSKFESDSDSDSERKGSGPGEGRKSRFQGVDSPGGSPSHITRNRSPSADRGPPKSKEEIMQEVMMKVRQMLTMILLEVTNEEMRSIAEEVHSKARMKGTGKDYRMTPATELQKTPALASLTGRLGLGIYEDSEEESGTDSEVDTVRQANGADSDEDLRETIRRKKQDFQKIEREIEDDLAEEEERERRMREKEEEDEDDDDESEDQGRNEEKSVRAGGSKNQAQVDHQKAGSNLHLKDHGPQDSGDAPKVDPEAAKEAEPSNHQLSKDSGHSPSRGSRRGTSSDDDDGHESSTSKSSSSRGSSRRKSSKRDRGVRRREKKSKSDRKRKQSSSREGSRDDKKSKSGRRDSEESLRKGKSRSRSRSESAPRRGRDSDRRQRDSSRESSRVGSRHDRTAYRSDSYRDRGREKDRDRLRDRDRDRDRDRERDRDRDRDRDSRRKRGSSRSHRSSSRGRSGSRSKRSTSRSRRSDSRSRRSVSRTRSSRSRRTRSRSRSRRSRSTSRPRRRRDSTVSRSRSPSKSRRRKSRSRSRSTSRSHHKSSRRRRSSESSTERSSGKKSRHRRRD